MAFKVKLWGIRGSLPAPHSPQEIKQKLSHAIKSFLVEGHNSVDQVKSFLDSYPTHLGSGYGGHTTCVEVFNDKGSIIIDGGSGLRKKGEALERFNSEQGSKPIHILLTHFHWDHLMGLPFFNPLFTPNQEVHFYAVQEDLENAIRMIFKKPYFPVSFENLQSKIHFHRLEPRKRVEINGFAITPYLLDHPDPCWGFKVEQGGFSYSHCVDTECTRATQEELGEDLALYQNVDLMLFDAQYSVQQASERINWGHASATFGLDVGLREGIKRILFVHHDPAATDTDIKQIEKEVRIYFNSVMNHQNNIHKNTLQWQFAFEGMVIKVGE